MHPYGLQMPTDKPALTAETVWSDRVYELQKTDPVDGGVDGIDNLPLNQLTSRTNYLRVMGIGAWAAVFNYPIGAFCQVSGAVYRATVANTGKPPASNPSIWAACPMTAAEISAALNFVTALNGKQDADNTLTALANLATSADKMIYATGADQFALTPLTAFIRTLLDDDDAAAARVTLGAAPLASPSLTGTPAAPTPATGTRSTQLATTAFVGAESQIAAPVGSVYTFAGATVPTGWLKCNGALLSRTTYAALFAVIGTTYGAGDGSTTFALPDLRGEFVRGFDDGRGIDAGRALGSWRDHILQSHNHFLPTSAGVAGGAAVIADNLWTGGNAANYTASAGWAPSTTYPNPLFGSGAEVGSIGNFGGETAPRSIAMHYIIKF